MRFGHQVSVVVAMAVVAAACSSGAASTAGDGTVVIREEATAGERPAIPNQPSAEFLRAERAFVHAAPLFSLQQELGLADPLEAWQYLPKPIVDFTTKFEPEDRAVSKQEAILISGLSADQFLDLGKALGLASVPDGCFVARDGKGPRGNPARDQTDGGDRRLESGITRPGRAGDLQFPQSLVVVQLRAVVPVAEGRVSFRQVGFELQSTLAGTFRRAYSTAPAAPSR